MSDNYATLLINEIKATETDIMVGTQGACGEFALLLYDALLALGESSRIGLCCDDEPGSKTLSQSGDIMRWSHFVVEYDSKLYDIRGETTDEKLLSEFCSASIVFIDRSEAEHQAQSARSDLEFLFTTAELQRINRWRSIFEKN